jgi:hypothetical protein
MEAWTVLVNTCGAQSDSSGHGWESFRRYVTTEHPWHEFRFCGALGFGGKLHLSQSSVVVSRYPEDSTPERDRRVRLANEKLSALVDGWAQEGGDE